MTVTNNPSDDTAGACDRRGFIRTVLRACALGGLLGGGYALSRRGPALPGQTCVADGICSRCRALADCGLPQALSLKAVRGERAGEDALDGGSGP